MARLNYRFLMSVSATLSLLGFGCSSPPPEVTIDVNGESVPALTGQDTLTTEAVDELLRGHNIAEIICAQEFSDLRTSPENSLGEVTMVGQKVTTERTPVETDQVLQELGDVPMGLLFADEVEFSTFSVDLLLSTKDYAASATAECTPQPT